MSIAQVIIKSCLHAGRTDVLSLVVGRTNRHPFTRTRTNGPADERTSIVIANLLVHLPCLALGVAASLVEDRNRARPPLGAAGTTTRAKGETGKGREREEKRKEEPLS